MASISLSIYDVTVLHPAVEVVIAIRPASNVDGTNHFADKAAITIEAPEVNTRRATVLGFVTSK